jgi:hypothetical protein
VRSSTQASTRVSPTAPMSKRVRSVGPAGDAAGEAQTVATARSPKAASAVRPEPSVSSERTRLLELIPRLPQHQLQRIIVDAVRADDRVVAALGPVLHRPEPRVARCAVCHKKYDASSNGAKACKSKEHDWECSRHCDNCSDDDCGDCARCNTTLCVAGTARRAGTTKQFCYSGPHVEVLPRYIRADYDDDESGEGSGD